MEAVAYSNFRNNLKSYMRKVNDEFEPLVVVNKDSSEDIVVLSKSIQETLLIAKDKELSDKILRGMQKIRQGKTTQHHLLEDQE